MKAQEFKPDIDEILLSMENKVNTTLDVTDPLELAKNIQSEFKSNMVVKKNKTQGKNRGIILTCMISAK